MCGIAGILSLDGSPVYEAEVRAMCAAMRHRGPDGEGYLTRKQISLGMRRLSIIDLPGGSQPVASEDRKVSVVFNGEIYNYQELTKDLTARGHVFRSSSDTEAIVHQYEEDGEACVERLRGMFAFAVWDERKRSLLLARDRLGIKPLYYAIVRGRLAFASELKALLELSEVDRRVDPRALSHLLAFLATPSSESILHGIHKLPPGHVLRVDSNALRLSRYWDVDFEPERGRSEASLAEELRGLLDEAVRLHMVSDVPLGAFLSGGIDSAAVVESMSRQAGNVKTFSIGFQDADFSELEGARQLARHVGSEHHELVLEPSAVDVLEDITFHLDEPFGDSSSIPTYKVAELASPHVKVVLSGDGGDELFAGYDRYRVEGRERIWRHLPGPARRALARAAAALPPGMRGKNFLRHVTRPGPERYLDASTVFRRDQQVGLLRAEVVHQLRGYDPWGEDVQALQRPHRHWLSALQRWDLQSYLPQDILTKVDRMTMAHSLEARPPLVDHKLVEFAARVPPGWQLRGGVGKAFFRKALRPRLPGPTLQRGKRGFAIPLGRWFKGGLRDFASDLLLSPGSRSREFFEVAGLRRLVEAPSGDDLGLGLWTVLSFELWSRRFLVQKQARVQAEKRLWAPVGSA